MTVTTIDITPTWEQILSSLLFLFENGNPTGRASARAELTRMAQIADAHVAASKAPPEPTTAEVNRRGIEEDLAYIYASGHRIRAVKLHRATLGSGLIEAKQRLDEIVAARQAW